MQNLRKIISVLLCVVLLFLCVVINISAETSQGKIIGSNTNLRQTPTTAGNNKILVIPIGSIVTVLDTVEGQQALENGGTVWYHVDYNGHQGYVYGKYVSLMGGAELAYSDDFEQNLLNFPESYREPLRNLHAAYPNWKFVAHNIYNLSLEDAINAQYGVSSVYDTRKVVELTFGGNEWRDMRAYNGKEWATVDTRWTYASYGAIAHYMDPRTSLTQYSMYVFMQQSFDSVTQTKDSLRSITNNTFLANGYDANGDGIVEVDAYLDDIMAAAGASGVSPFVLAATIIVEQGVDGASPLISGTYPGYEGYYNFFNFGAYGNGNELVTSGLNYAWNANWNSRSASILGGAMKYADGYIDVGQDTYYYKDFNVVNRAWGHQYATSLYDAWVSGSYLRKAFENNPYAELTFKIPVYSSMRDAVYQSPLVETNLPPEFDAETDNLPEVDTEKTAISKGDTNFDNTVNAVDLAAIKMHILNVKSIEGDSFVAADINDDNTINAVDLAAVKMHILGVKGIS